MPVMVPWAGQLSYCLCRPPVDTQPCHGADVPVLCVLPPALSWSSPCPHGDNWYDPAHECPQS